MMSSILELATILKTAQWVTAQNLLHNLPWQLFYKPHNGISDDEVIEQMVIDRRWQLVLDCLNCETPPLGKATLVRFRKGLIKKELDQRLIDRTVEIAKHSWWIWLIST